MAELVNQVSLKNKIFSIHDELVKSELDNLPTTPSSTLYHYTSLENAYKIIESGKLRFTNALYLNDPKEISCGLEILDSVGFELLNEYFAKKDKLKAGLLAAILCRVLLSFTLPSQRKAAEDSLTAKINGDVGPFTPKYFRENKMLEAWSIYVACLSEKNDDLRQWLPYGEDAKGVALGFAGFDGEHHDIMAKEGIWIIRTSYAETDKKRKYVRKFLEQILEEASLQNIGEDLFNNFMEPLTQMIIGDVIACKTSHYKDESEWRLFFKHSLSEVLYRNVPSPDFYLKGGLLKPFHDVELNKEALLDIKLGSRCNHDLNLNSFEFTAFRYGYGKVQLSISDVEYRGG